MKRTLYWHYPHYSNQGGRPGAAIREDNWKLIYNYEDSSVELYDLAKDMSEQHDLHNTEPTITQQLKQKLMAWLSSNNAGSPSKK